MKRLLPYLSLFGSLSTLICCALPALLVALGMGATLASMISVFPQLIWFSEHKLIVFGFAGILLVVAGVFRLSMQRHACPVDSKLAQACLSSKRAGSLIYYLSCGLFLIGAFFAFVAPYLV